MAIAASFYSNAVLGVWNAGQPIEAHLFRRLLLMHERDLSASEKRMVQDKEGSTLWFWQAFVAAYILQTHAWTRDKKINLRMFHPYIHRWSIDTEVLQWNQAKVVLGQTAWPNLAKVEEMAEQIWVDAVPNAVATI